MSFLLAAESSGGIGALGLNWTGLIFQLINFGILYWVLNRYAFPPILRLLAKRRAQIAAGLADAAAAKQALIAANAEREHILAAAREEATALVEAARTEAHREGRRIIDEAGAAAQATAAQAESRIAAKQAAARSELMSELGGMVAAATASVTREQLTPDADSRAIEEALREVTHA
jgi:F-type H+-transporting ATPase subunit b